MSRSWDPLPESVFSDVRLAAAGAVAFPVFALLLREGNNATTPYLVPAHRADPEQLAAGLAPWKVTGEAITNAIHIWRDKGVLEVLPRGEVDLRHYVATSMRAKTPAERSADYRQRMRNGRDRGRKPSRAVTNATRGVTAARQDTEKQTPPKSPPVETGATASEKSAPDGAPESAAAAAGLEQEGGSDPVMQIRDALERAGFGNQIDRIRVSADLHRTGVTGEDLDELARHAHQVGEEPERLFASWIRKGLAKSVIDEQRSKAKESRHRSQHQEARAAAEVA